MKKILMYVSLLLTYLGYREIKDKITDNKIAKLEEDKANSSNEIKVLKTQLKAKEIDDEINASINSGSRDDRLQQFDITKQGKR